MLTAINSIHSNAYQKGSPSTLCTLVVPRGTSKSSKSCPSHTCQISVSLPCLRKPWRAAAPLPAEEQEELWRQQDLVQPPGERGRWAWPPASLRSGSGPGAKPPAAASHLLRTTSVSAGSCCLNKAGLRITGPVFVLCISARIRVSCSLSLQGTEQKNPGNHSYVVITLSLPSSHGKLIMGPV